MQDKEVMKYGLKLYEENPYLSEYQVKFDTRTGHTLAHGLHIKDMDDNNVGVGVIAEVIDVDPESFVKFYTNNLQAVFDLSATARRVLLLLVHEMQEKAINRPSVYFTLTQANNRSKKLNIKAPSQPTFSKGMRELIDKDFIRGNAEGFGWYWINHTIMFNGDRVRFVKEYRKNSKKNIDANSPDYVFGRRPDGWYYEEDGTLCHKKSIVIDTSNVADETLEELQNG